LNWLTEINISTENAPKKIRIILADDHPLMRQAIRMWLEKQQDLEVIAEASDGREAIDIALKLQPDIVIMDISMPKINGLEATKEIVSRCPDTQVLVLTVHTDDEHIRGMLQAGISGYIFKNAPGEDIVRAVRSVYSGESVLIPNEPFDIKDLNFNIKPLPKNKINDLSVRELKILKYVANGLSNKDIASQLGLSIRSVKAILTSVFIKLGVASRTEAISIGLKSGILTLDDLNNKSEPK
jgi:two-component system, NarL family, response regulator LiaR